MNSVEEEHRSTFTFIKYDFGKKSADSMTNTPNDGNQFVLCDKKGQQNITTILVLPLTLALVPVIVAISITATVLSIPYGICSKTFGSK